MFGFVDVIPLSTGGYTFTQIRTLHFNGQRKYYANCTVQMKATRKQRLIQRVCWNSSTNAMIFFPKLCIDKFVLKSVKVRIASVDKVMNEKLNYTSVKAEIRMHLLR